MTTMMEPVEIVMEEPTYLRQEIMDEINQYMGH